MSDESPHGIWRDGSDLIVCPSEAVFPNVCVKTGEPAEGNFRSIHIGAGKTKLTWKQTLAVGIAAGTAKALAGSFAEYAVLDKYGAKHVPGFDLQIPLSANFLNSWKRQSVTGWYLIIASLLNFVLLTVIYVVGMLRGVHESSLAWILFLIPIPPITALVGAGCLFAFQRPIMTGTRISENLVRLQGLRPPYMDRLPTWDGTLK